MVTTLGQDWGKHFIGFDELFDSIEKMSRKQDNQQYPPYSIYRNGEDTFVISLAVAGFKKNEINIELKASSLTITGRKEKAEEKDAIEYIHRGISNRNFTRTFTLADDVSITDANLENGILDIHLERDRKKNVQTIPINDSHKVSYNEPPGQLNG